MSLCDDKTVDNWTFWDMKVKNTCQASKVDQFYWNKDKIVKYKEKICLVNEGQNF